MTKKPLSIQEIRASNEAHRKIFGFINTFKQENGTVVTPKYPQISSELSESLAFHLISSSIVLPELSGFSFDFGGRSGDIKATKGDVVRTIEVKATAKSAFQYFGPKDISADYLLWLHFDDYYLAAKRRPIEVYTIDNPGKHFLESTKITLPTLKTLVGKDLRAADIDIESLS
jgi:hypothetical protein